ncbi:MAG: MFS transporter [Candidatus Bathyarchaeota archaeon]|nr:MAG: MFS transporter [Candidatus Bathyarchaeota archaeon]
MYRHCGFRKRGAIEVLDFLRREFSFITGNYRILVISWIIMDIAMEMPNPYFQYFIEDVFEGPPMTLGLIGLANFLAMAAVAFPGGYLTDKYGRRWLITTMTFGMALSWLFFAFAPTWHFVLIGTIVSSLCLIYQPALFAMVQDSLPPERRGMGSSIIQLIHGTFNTPGPVIAGILYIQFGLEGSMRIIYLLMTGLYLTAAVWRLRLKETMKKREPIRFRYFFSSYPQAIKESFRVWKVVPRSMFWLAAVQTMVMFGMSLTWVINALYARDVLLIPSEQWWIVHIPLLLTMVVASIPIGFVVDRFGRKVPLIIAMFVLGAGTFIFINGTLVTVIVSMILFGVAQLLAMSALVALSTDLVDQRNRGKVNGFINFIGYIMMGFGMLLGNYLFVEGTNIGLPQLPFYGTLLLIAPELVITLFFIREPKTRASMVQEHETDEGLEKAAEE